MGNNASLKVGVKKVASLSLRAAKRVAKKILGYVPPSAGRLTGTLARDGGRPVRDTRFRPWPEYPRCGFWEYVFRVAPTFRRIFRANLEGLPGELAAEFNKRWAEFCGARYAILTPHGTDA